MSDSKCGNLILDAIDQLRKRKARPDLDRICHMLERRHGLKGTVVNEELAKLVSAGTVVKVDYKGNTSYRNAAKWVKTKTQFQGGFYNTCDVTAAVLDSVRALSIPTKDHPQLRSASLQEIEQCLHKRDVPFNLTVATLRTVLDREVSKGNLHQLQNGEYMIVRLKCNNNIDSNSSDKNSDCDRKHDCSFSSKSPKSYADSSHGSSNSSLEDSHPSRCDYCLFTAAANRKGEPEELLICRDCGAKAHPSCMEYTKLLYESFPQPQNWQCPDCKTCVVCDETANMDDMSTCYICLKGYHIACHEPSLSSKPSGVWICSDCDTADNPKEKCAKKFKSHHSADEYEPSVISQRDEFFKSLEQYPSSVPLAKKWSIENVEFFLKFLGFVDEASAFREQEIDGMSLLLMKRSDVITGLGIKLGPAVKIYKHIVKLQSRVADN